MWNSRHIKEDDLGNLLMMEDGTMPIQISGRQYTAGSMVHTIMHPNGDVRIILNVKKKFTLSDEQLTQIADNPNSVNWCILYKVAIIPESILLEYWDILPYKINIIRDILLSEDFLRTVGNRLEYWAMVETHQRLKRFKKEFLSEMQLKGYL